MDKETLKTIGNREWCAFNTLNIPAIRARIDSGAKTSSIQATDIKLFKKDNIDWVQFNVFPLQENSTIKILCTAPLLDKRSVKGSFGISEERLIIEVPVTLGKDTFKIELSLANRNTMEFRMLLGREAISGRYLINSAERHVQKRYSKKSLAEIYSNPTN